MDQAGFEESIKQGSSEDRPELERTTCCLCKCQGNIQSVIRPAMWVPGIRTPHYYKERWEIGTNKEVCTTEIVSAVKKLNRVSDGGVIYDINKILEDNFVQIFVYTRFNSLYVVEIKIEPDPESKGGRVLAEARSFSTGLLPLCFPFALIFNIILFPIPYYDFKRSRLWLQKIRETIGLEVTVSVGKRSC